MKKTLLLAATIAFSNFCFAQESKMAKKDEYPMEIDLAKAKQKDGIKICTIKSGDVGRIELRGSIILSVEGAKHADTLNINGFVLPPSLPVEDMRPRATAYIIVRDRATGGVVSQFEYNTIRGNRSSVLIENTDVDVYLELWTNKVTINDNQNTAYPLKAYYYELKASN